MLMGIACVPLSPLLTVLLLRGGLTFGLTKLLQSVQDSLLRRVMAFVRIVINPAVVLLHFRRYLHQPYFLPSLAQIQGLSIMVSRVSEFDF